MIGPGGSAGDPASVHLPPKFTTDWSDPGQRLPRAEANGQFILDLDGFEGPIDLLLSLARDQKVDLARIRIVPLADQYLAFIARARELRLELAADYLVMAAWLAYLKSRLLLPEPPAEPGPSAEELASDLAFQLRRLEAMQKVGRKLMALPRLGYDRFARGAPEAIEGEPVVVWQASLYDLLRAYGAQHARAEPATLTIAPTRILAVEDALERLRARIGLTVDWQALTSFLNEFLGDRPTDPLVIRSVLAATFAATLELAKAGVIELSQSGVFEPLYLKKRI
jgi:segregation and condensation protein A